MHAVEVPEAVGAARLGSNGCLGFEEMPYAQHSYFSC